MNLYKHMVGFVMSYSFTDHENNETLMVPVADIFNHHTNNNAQLSFDDESMLRMISTKPIKKVRVDKSLLEPVTLYFSAVLV